MKTNLYYLFFFFVTMSSFAQSPNDYRTKMNSVFANVSKTPITTGYLSDYAFPLIPLENFNGILNANNVANAQIWQMTYATWYSSYIASATIPGVNPATVSTNIRTSLSGATSTPITLLFASYNSLKPNAVTSNLLSVSNNQFNDVAGRPQSPYDTRTLFVAAPARDFFRNNVVSFVFNTSLRWGNGATISNVAIDFGAGYQTATFGTPISNTFTTKGVKRIKVRVTPSSGPIVESHFDINVLKVTGCPTCRFTGGPNANQIFPGTANHAGGTAEIYYSMNNTSNPRRVKKPLIVVEGLDISTIAPRLQQNYIAEDFIASINNLGGANPTNYDFNAALDNASYDIVFLNFNNGTDAIPRNAALLQAVITWVNGQKQAGDAQNVVFGQSMGGLVGRYALANMVRTSVATQTRLLMTLDSPHRGANIPLGIQMAARAAGAINFSLNVFGTTIVSFNARNSIPELDDVLRLYDEPAPTQMLINRVTTDIPTVENNTFLAADYWNMVNLPSAPPYKVIATSDGSQCGVALFAPSTQLVNFSASGFFSPIPWISNNKLKSDFTINASANQAASQLVNLKVYSNYTILSLIPINITLYQRSLNGPAVLPYDGAAGGVYPVSQFLGGNATFGSSFKVLWFLNANYSATLRDEFTFIPVPSGLDLTTFNAASLTASNVDAVNPANPSRMGRFIAQESFTRPGTSTTVYNEAHVRFTARNSNWMFNEMENPASNVLHCTNECPLIGVSIAGPSPLCTTGTYTLSPTLAGSTLAWASSNTSAFTINPTSGIATKVGNSLSANVTTTVNGCNVGLSKAVWVGNPSLTKTINGTIAGTTPVVAGNLYNLNATSGSPSTTFNYNNYNGTGNMTIDLYSPNSPATQMYVYSNSTVGSRYVRVTATNGCGSYSEDFVFYLQSGMMKAYPNPATDVITFEFSNPEIAEALPDRIEMFTEQAKSVKSISVQETYSSKGFKDGNKIFMNVQDLPRGTYYIHVIPRKDSDQKVEQVRFLLK